MNKYERAQMYVKYFQSRGFSAIPTLTGDVRIHNGPREYTLTYHDTDDGYFRFTRQFWQAVTRREHDAAHKAAAAVPKTEPEARIVIEDGNVYAIAEMVWPGHLYATHFHRQFINSIETVIESFITIMRSALPQPPAQKFPLTKRARAEAYCSSLTTLTYSARVTDVNETEFTHANRKYTIIPDDNNDHELIISTTDPLAKITDDADHARAAAIAEKITRIAPRVILWSTPDGSVYASIHMYLQDPLNICRGFIDTFHDFQNVVNKFAAEWAAAKAVNP